MPAVLHQPLPAAPGLHLRIVDDHGRPLSVDAVLARWCATDDDGLRHCWTDTLRALPYRACFLELPALQPAMLAQPFECVALDAPQLAAVRGPADRDSFRRAFVIDDGTPFAHFDNLGGDALLIAPRPLADGRDYRHLLEFLRRAPAADAEALWPRIAALLPARLAAGPVWLSTAGLGVNWLHVRLDQRPKYFQHRHYAQFG